MQGFTKYEVKPPEGRFDLVFGKRKTPLRGALVVKGKE
jgi:hypothetical protein